MNELSKTHCQQINNKIGSLFVTTCSLSCQYSINGYNDTGNLIISIHINIPNNIKLK
jgi:hypothetical protein